MKKLLLFGNYGGQNWGDEAICAGLIAALQKTKVHITVVSADPDFTMAHHPGIVAVYRPPFGFRSFFAVHRLWGFVSALRDADLVLYGGGGLFQDREAKAPLLWWYYTRWAKWFGKKYIFVANSVGPLAKISSRFFARAAFRDARFISVRDTDSQKILLHLGIADQKIVVATDAAFYLRKSAVRAPRKGTLIIIRGDGKISIKRIQKLLINKAFPKPIRLVSMDNLDKLFVQKNGIKQSKFSHLTELRKNIARSQLVISARLHGCILALLEETPFVALVAAPKIKSFFIDRSLKHAILPENSSENTIVTCAQHVLLPSEAKKLRSLRQKECQHAQNILPFFLQ